MAKKKSKSLAKRRCKGCEGISGPLDEKGIRKLLKGIPDWTLEDGRLVRHFEFMNFHQTIEFVNMIAWLCNLENHHPDLQVSYSACTVQFITHSVGGLTENDFIVASKIDAILKL
ncbi:MAG: 4a-hydroxytetrahydrobiopterin dehydratase [Phycisphaerae bacterium]